ncbi:dethiobiotin synthase [Chitinophaga polysaccharea]|uniref:dethiobiotin synthase n=1 Tax=Chitinophaga TaxID=79328 RepID=UPI001455D78B|nr:MULTISPECIES: dethiobiotin synthase [Chitinophaga]NLR60230.1 dethiobiotin synthase [Chitinophaga polysaccharea]NLU95878.1 dethiobiotin synthase [Chitinophaga sp. Ak27]
MSERIFITGIGTGVGKTISAACVTEALQADYWKPVQTGLLEGTDTDTVGSLLSNNVSVCHPEAWLLKAPASPHLAARLENKNIDINRIVALSKQYQPLDRALVMEGAGGLLVPINETLSTLDLILALGAKVLVVAQNYLGSINHAMLTARVLQHTGVPVIGWVFNGDYHTNEDDIVRWSGYPKIGRIPQANPVDKAFVQQQAQLLSASLHTLMA